MNLSRRLASIGLVLAAAAVACAPMPTPGTTTTTTSSTTSSTTTSTSTTSTTLPPLVDRNTRIATGAFHSCAITVAGGVVCWGLNGYGQLGTGVGTGSSTTPVAVTGLGGKVDSIVATANTTCALTNVGGVECWGQNSFGQLGNGTTTHSPVPVDVSGLTSGVTAISAGPATFDSAHVCAVTDAGELKCWGPNGFGQLGDGNSGQNPTGGPIFSSVPVSASAVSQVVDVAAGGGHTCVLDESSAVSCWGANFNGQLGDGTTTNRTTPAPVSGLSSGVTAISAGGSHSCALNIDTTVVCWGANLYGQLGNGTTTDRTTPNIVGDRGGFTSIATGGNHTCAIDDTTQVLCWGNNSAFAGGFGFTLAGGQVGDGSTIDRRVPRVATGLSGVTHVDGGTGHTCALFASGAVGCTGDNQTGQLGDGTTTSRTTAGNVLGLP